MEEMEWNVFYHSINSQKIVTFNVFDHISFSEDVDKLLTKRCDKENFDKELHDIIKDRYSYGKIVIDCME